MTQVTGDPMAETRARQARDKRIFWAVLGGLLVVAVVAGILHQRAQAADEREDRARDVARVVENLIEQD